MGAVRTSHVFFLGLGGIGMSALARHLKLLGHEVGGYDLTPSPLLEMLANEGMDVTHSSEPMDLPRWAKDATPDTLTVVWTPAVPQDLPLLTHFKARGIVPIKRAALLGQITDGRPTLAVAGTHGKTTTSSWLAAMLDVSTEGCHAFLGGISATSGCNDLPRPGATWHVVVAVEFERSFLHLHPPSRRSRTSNLTTSTSTEQRMLFASRLSNLEAKFETPSFFLQDSSGRKRTIQQRLSGSR